MTKVPNTIWAKSNLAFLSYVKLNFRSASSSILLWDSIYVSGMQNYSAMGIIRWIKCLFIQRFVAKIKRQQHTIKDHQNSCVYVLSGYGSYSHVCASLFSIFICAARQTNLESQTKLATNSGWLNSISAALLNEIFSSKELL